MRCTFSSILGFSFSCWGLTRCKNLRSFSLFSSYCFPWLYCVGFSVASLYSLFYVTREFHRFYTEDEPVLRKSAVHTYLFGVFLRSKYTKARYYNDMYRK